MFHTGIGTATYVPETHASDMGDSSLAVQDEPPGGGLYFQRCRWCHNVTFQRLLCPTCASTDLEAKPSKGVGIVQRSVVIGRHTAQAHSVSVIDMAEGFSVRGKVVGPPEKVRPGSRVRVTTSTDSTDDDMVFQLYDGPNAGRSSTATADALARARRMWAVAPR